MQVTPLYQASFPHVDQDVALQRTELYASEVLNPLESEVVLQRICLHIAQGK
jgi:hypothetical protein